MDPSYPFLMDENISWMKKSVGGITMAICFKWRCSDLMGRKDKDLRYLNLNLTDRLKI